MGDDIHSRPASAERIFISYRRSDTQWAAGRLADSLAAYFGDDRVFRDIEGIVPGERFDDKIDTTLGNADAVVVVIGREWLSTCNESGERRLDDDDDWVVREVASALDRGLPVYPVLVDNAPMPRAEELPESLRGLTRHNAMSLSDSRWPEDVARLGKILSLDIPSATGRLLQKTNIIVSSLLFLAMLFTMTIVTGNLLQQSASTDDWSIMEFFNWEGVNDSGSWVGRMASSLTGGSDKQNVGDCQNPPHPWLKPLSKLQAGIVFLVMVPASALLFVLARHVDPVRRVYTLAAAWTGTLGSFVTFVLFYPVCNEYETIVIFYLGMLIAPMMLVLMGLSGFKEK